MEHRTLSRNNTLSWLLGIFCITQSVIAQAEEMATPTKAAERSPLATREMLEFLADFSELDDTEFELLTAYAERDAAEEPQDSDND